MSRILFLLLLTWCQTSVEAASRVLELFDKNDFIESPKIAETYWSNRNNNLYGKSVILWTGEDFDALDGRLRQQLVEERALYLASIERRGSISLDDKLRYQSHQANLEAAMKALPEIRVWVDIARAESGEWRELKSESAKAGDDKGAVDVEKPAEGEADATNPERYLQVSPEEKADEQVRLREFLERERIARNRKSMVLLYAGATAIGVIVVIVAWVWFRYFRVRVVVCPKCNSEDRSKITASSPLASGSNFPRLKVRRKYYCGNCGFKWIQRTR